MARIVTVTANPLLNFITDRVVHSETVNRVPHLTPMAEGKGVNVAKVLARAGHQVHCCGFAGGATGQLLATLLTDAGLTHHFITTEQRLRVGFMAAPPTARHPTTILEHGFAVSSAETAALVTSVEQELAVCDLVIISGSVPDDQAASAYPAIAAACSRAGIPCWIDSYGAGMAAALAGPQVHLAKPNRQEYTSCKGWQNVAELHVTDGGAGTTVSTEAGDWHITPPPIEQVNPVGSGDCYLAGLAHGRLTGLDFADQLKLAAAAGAANAARADIAMIDLNQLENLSEQVNVIRGH